MVVEKLVSNRVISPGCMSTSETSGLAISRVEQDVVNNTMLNSRLLIILV